MVPMRGARRFVGHVEPAMAAPERLGSSSLTATSMIGHGSPPFEERVWTGPRASKEIDQAIGTGDRAIRRCPGHPRRGTPT
jgi:hypothetical protein